MKNVKLILRLAFVVGIAVAIIAGNIVAAIGSFGIACLNIGILIGERSKV